MAVLKSGGIRLVPRFPLVGHLEAGAPIDPSNPTPHVRPKRGGVTRRLPLLLIKPGCAFDESLHGVLGNRYALRAEVVAEEIEAPLDLADEGLIRVL